MEEKEIRYRRRERHMLKRTAIRALCNTTAYQRGLDIYRTGKKILFLEIQPKGAVDKVSATVKGSGRNVYNTGFQYNESAERVSEAYCDCPAFRSYSGICKHCVAVLLEYGDRKSYERLEARKQQDKEQKQAELFGQTAFPATVSGAGQPATKTTVELKSLLNRQMYSRMITFSGDPYFGRVELETCLKFNSVGNCFTVEFRIGCEKKYILKDVLAFVWNVDHNERVSYGKNLEFIHSEEAFSRESRGVLAFIREWVENHHGTYMARYEQLKNIAVEKVRDLTVDRKELEDLLLILGENGFKFKMNNDPETTWHAVGEIPDRTLTIRKKDQGLSLEIAPVYSVTGIQYHMYFDSAKVYLVSRQELGAVEEFVTCLERLPAGRGFIDEPDVPAFVRELLPSLEKFFHCDLRDFQEGTGLECYKAAYEIYLDAPERDWITCKAFSVYGEDKFSVFDRSVSARTRDIPGEMGVFAMLSKYFNGYDAQRMELALDCRAGEYGSLNGENAAVNMESSVITPVTQIQGMDDMTGMAMAVGMNGQSEGMSGGIKDSEEKLYQLLNEGIPAMQKLGTVYISQAIKQMRVTKMPRIRLGVSLSAGLLNLDMDVEGMDQAQLFDILSRYDRKKKYFRLKDGSFLDVSDGQLRELSVLKDGMQISDSELKKGKTQVPAYRAMYLDSQLKGGDLIKVEKDNAFRALIRNMQIMEKHKFQIPREQEKILRGYQKEGFCWIKTLKHNQFGGILADDMGLGKTLQVIAFLWSEFQESAPGENRRALVVTPASLVFNWMNEIERFAPGLPATVVTGDAKERKALVKNAGEREVLITSYDLLKRDLKAYQKLNFAVQVIDEAQYIKNHGTQAAKAVKEIRSEFRLALTGTPVENRLSELWSIFDFLMPGFLYSYEKFRKEIELPAVQYSNSDAMERLQKMIRPFVLRRLKRDVLKDLPDKLEKDMFSPLESEQKELYEAHTERLRLMLGMQSDSEFRNSKLQILAEITRLRQICCYPGLIYEGYKGNSSKLEMCMELVRNAVNGGHKILLFSQFTTMLDVLTERLKKERISFYMLTGATSKEKRARLVKAFNEDDTSVFCISLKAGGTGLNLTAADIVIHYDPWWNLAVQNQATDRAHRIGQQNVVSVYRLFMKDTIEERIRALQEMKRELADEILSGEGIGQALISREEVLELLGRQTS